MLQRVLSVPIRPGCSRGAAHRGPCRDNTTRPRQLIQIKIWNDKCTLGRPHSRVCAGKKALGSSSAHLYSPSTPSPSIVQGPTPQPHVRPIDTSTAAATTTTTTFHTCRMGCWTKHSSNWTEDIEKQTDKKVGPSRRPHATLTGAHWARGQQTDQQSSPQPKLKPASECEQLRGSAKQSTCSMPCAVQGSRSRLVPAKNSCAAGHKPEAPLSTHRQSTHTIDLCATPPTKMQALYCLQLGSCPVGTCRQCGKDEPPQQGQARQTTRDLGLHSRLASGQKMATRLTHVSLAVR